MVRKITQSSRVFMRWPEFKLARVTQRPTRDCNELHLFLYNGKVSFGEECISLSTTLSMILTLDDNGRVVILELAITIRLLSDVLGSTVKEVSIVMAQKRSLILVFRWIPLITLYNRHVGIYILVHALRDFPFSSKNQQWTTRGCLRGSTEWAWQWTQRMYWNVHGRRRALWSTAGRGDRHTICLGRHWDKEPQDRHRCFSNGTCCSQTILIGFILYVTVLGPVTALFTLPSLSSQLWNEMELHRVSCKCRRLYLPCLGYLSKLYTQKTSYLH